MTVQQKQPVSFNWKSIISSPLAVIALAREKYNSAQEARKRVDNVIDIIDPSIKSVRGYQKRLAPPIRQCEEHCAKIVTQIPGPIPLDAANYSSSPLIKAAFPDQTSVATILQQADAQEIGLDEKVQDRVALLTMTHSESDFFGTAREGQMVLADARLKAVTFSDHKVVGIATTLEDSRQRLGKVIFDVIIEYASNELADQRADLGELREQRAKLRAMSKIFGESAPESGEIENEMGQKLSKVKLYLEETENNLSTAKERVETPEQRLDYVVDFLSRPEQVMDIKLVSLRLDWSNIITNDPEISAKTITFAQCEIHKEKKRDAVLISYALKKNRELVQ